MGELGVIPAGETVGIVDIAVSLPDKVIDNAEVAEEHGFDKGFVLEKLGIRQRHVLNETDTVADLAAGSVTELLRQTSIEPEQVELLIVVTQTGDFQLPQVSSLVQSLSGLPTKTAAFDVGLGCSGYVYGLALTKSLIASGAFRNAVLVTVDAYSRIVDPNDRATAPLFGDAATATLVSVRPQYAIGSAVLATDGSRAGALMVQGSGSLRQARGFLSMDGRAILDFALREVPRSVHECLSRNGIAIKDVNAFVFHQANRFMLDQLARTLDVNPSTVIADLEDVGNTTSSSIPIALKRRVLPESFRPDVVLLSGFGVGLSWGSIVLRSMKTRGRCDSDD